MADNERYKKDSTNQEDWIELEAEIFFHVEKTLKYTPCHFETQIECEIIEIDSAEKVLINFCVVNRPQSQKNERSFNRLRSNIAIPRNSHAWHNTVWWFKRWYNQGGQRQFGLGESLYSLMFQAPELRANKSHTNIIIMLELSSNKLSYQIPNN